MPTEEASQRLAEIEAINIIDSSKDASLFGDDDHKYIKIKVPISENGYAICEACRTGKGNHIGIPAKIRDWNAFHDSKLKKDKFNTDIDFTRLLNKHNNG